MVDKLDAVDLDYVRGEIKLCNVSFKYDDDTALVINGLNLHIRAGEIVALVGPSGGGKTTLVKLLLRLYDPNSGESFEIMIYAYLCSYKKSGLGYILEYGAHVIVIFLFIRIYLLSYACRLYTD